MTDLANIAQAILLIAGEDEHSEKRTGLDQIAKQMETANSDRSYDSERLSIAILTAAESVAGALNRIADAIEKPGLAVTYPAAPARPPAGQASKNNASPFLGWSAACICWPRPGATMSPYTHRPHASGQWPLL